MNKKPLEHCTLPELALRLMEDDTRQSLADIYSQQQDGKTSDAIQMIKLRLDQGADPNERDAQKRTALDILIAPEHRVPTDPDTVFDLLKAGAWGYDDAAFFDFMRDRLFSRGPFDIALLFDQRRQTEHPLRALELGNYYHSLADGSQCEFILISPMLDIRRNSDDTDDLTQADLALLREWLFEIRPIDGNNPVMMAWEQVVTIINDGSQEQISQFEQYALSQLWYITSRYIESGGDLQLKNKAGSSISSMVREIDTYLAGTHWEYAQITPEAANAMRAQIQADALQDKTTPSDATRARPRI